MPTNANTFNSRVTSEALEAKFRQVFPSQGGAELPQDLFASGVLQPVIDFSSVAEGSVLRSDLQRAWDFSTGNAHVQGSSTTAINNTGFWKVGFSFRSRDDNVAGDTSTVTITDGLSSKVIWRIESAYTPNSNAEQIITWETVVFLKTGENLVLTAGADHYLGCSHRQIADVNGNLVNPLGFTFS